MYYRGGYSPEKHSLNIKVRPLRRKKLTGSMGISHPAVNTGSF